MRRKLLLLMLTVFLPGAGIIVQDGIQVRRRELEDAKSLDSSGRLTVYSL
jgi:hypothetical protein